MPYTANERNKSSQKSCCGETTFYYFAEKGGQIKFIGITNTEKSQLSTLFLGLLLNHTFLIRVALKQILETMFFSNFIKIVVSIFISFCIFLYRMRALWCEVKSKNYLPFSLSNLFLSLSIIRSLNIFALCEFFIQFSIGMQLFLFFSFFACKKYWVLLYQTILVALKFGGLAIDLDSRYSPP